MVIASNIFRLSLSDKLFILMGLARSLLPSVTGSLLLHMVHSFLNEKEQEENGDNKHASGPISTGISRHFGAAIPPPVHFLFQRNVSLSRLTSD